MLLRRGRISRERLGGLFLSLAGWALVLASCKGGIDAGQKRLQRAQTRVFPASFEEVFSVLVEVLSRDYELSKVEPQSGIIETEPKRDVVLRTGDFQGIYSLKVRAWIYRQGPKATKVRLRVLAGRLLDIVENRWLYRDFGTPQYYREYFRVIEKALKERSQSRRQNGLGVRPAGLGRWP